MKNQNYKEQFLALEDKDKKLLKGLTLIEMLVAMVIFSVLLIAFLNLFTSAFKNQQKALDSVELLNSISFVTEYTSRALRMAQNDTEGVCIPKFKTFKITAAGESIKFLNSKGECQEFYLENEMMWVKKSLSQPLTSNKLIIEDLTFFISGESKNDDLQPKATFVLKLRTKKAYSQIINIQTSVSQRALDIAY